MKLLCLAQNFRQGWGGGRNRFACSRAACAPVGFSVDVFDRGTLHTEVERLDLLPERGAPARRFAPETVDRYGAILIADLWQYPWFTGTVLRLRRGRPLLCLPRGSLAEIEFARPRDLKKWPYLYLIERPMIDACDALVFSSERERRAAIRAARGRTREVVIPDFFAAPEPQACRAGTGEMRFGFLAEISPRKGLVPLVEAFVQFARRPGFDRRVRLTVGGSIRKGSEAYTARARALAARAPPHATIEFVGPVPHGDRGEFYAGTDVFVVSSRSESFSLTALEALAAGCAVIAAPELGVLEYLEPHERLTIAPSGEPGDLATTLSAQFDRVAAEHGDRRRDTQAYARRTVDSLNARATRQWLDLLNGPGG